MPIYIGSSIKNQQQISLGSTRMQKVYVGDKLVWSKPSGFTPIKYGLLYNFHVGVDSRNICSVGWHIPTTANIGTLNTYAGGSLVAGGKLKETGLLHWNTPNTGATNEYGFNGRGNGYRQTSGSFLYLNVQFNIWTTSTAYGDAGNYYRFFNNSITTSGAPGSGSSQNKHDGMGLRPFKDSTTLTHGQTGTYTDPSGLVYPTICVGTQEIVACNIRTINYRNGDFVHGFELGTYTPISNSVWAALTTEGCCAYADNLANV